jgi:hypothetical protein
VLASQIGLKLTPLTDAVPEAAKDPRLESTNRMRCRKQVPVKLGRIDHRSVCVRELHADSSEWSTGATENAQRSALSRGAQRRPLHAVVELNPPAADSVTLLVYLGLRIPPCV